MQLNPILVVLQSLDFLEESSFSLGKVLLFGREGVGGSKVFVRGCFSTIGFSAGSTGFVLGRGSGRGCKGAAASGSEEGVVEVSGSGGGEDWEGRGGSMVLVSGEGWDWPRSGARSIH